MWLVEQRRCRGLTQSLYNGKPLHNGPLLHHPHHAQRQRHRHHDGKPLWDGSHRQAGRDGGVGLAEPPLTGLGPAEQESGMYLTPMVNMSKILFPCSQPTSMITPDTQETAGLREATPLPHWPHNPSGVQTDDAERVERELLPQQVHALLQRCLGCLQKTGKISGETCSEEQQPAEGASPSCAVGTTQGLAKLYDWWATVGSKT